MLFAHQGTKADTLATLAAARAWAVEQNAGNLEAGRSYATGAGEFQTHAAQNMLAGAFLTELYRMVATWADWAAGLVEQWPDDPAEAVPDLDVLAAVVRRAEWSREGSAEALGQLDE